MSFYQHLPEFINPIVFSIGSFNIRWYSLMYLAAFTTVYFLLRFRITGGEMDKIQNSKLKVQNDSSKLKIIGNWKISQKLILDFILYAFLGLIIGARLGYVLFYNLNYFISSPLAIISPFDSSGNFVGIFGMSYFGGLIGIVITTLIFAKKRKINFWQWADFVVPAIPAGYFFGRIGNFLNGELYGKATGSFLGMYFPTDNLGLLRHPTQLYEAFLEGFLLFIILWLVKGKEKFKGNLLAIYLFGYGIIRFFIEFLRQPEGTPYFGLTTGQILSLLIIAISAIIFLHKIKTIAFKKIRH